MIDGRGHGGLVAVGVEHLPGEIEINPRRSQLLVGLTQSLKPSVAEFLGNHVGLGLPLVDQAESSLGNRRTQIDQMPHRAAVRNQRACGTSQRVGHYHHVVVTSPKRSAHHIRVGIEVRRPVLTRQLRRDDVMSCLL